MNFECHLCIAVFLRQDGYNNRCLQMSLVLFSTLAGVVFCGIESVEVYLGPEMFIYVLCSLNWQHQLCKNPRQNPDIKTLFVDHTCSPPNGARAPTPVTLPPGAAVPKPLTYAPLGAHAGVRF